VGGFVQVLSIILKSRPRQRLCQKQVSRKCEVKKKRESKIEGWYKAAATKERC